MSNEPEDSAGPDPSDEIEPSAEPEESVGTALVEVSPGTALVFGKTPEGFDLVPFSLVSPEDQAAIGAAVAASSAVLNVGGQLAPALAQAQGLVRLAPETLRAMQAGATPIQSGGYNIGVLAAQNGKFAAQVRWLPAGGVQAAGVIASIGPAVAMIAIQIQLNELSGLVRQNLALTEGVLKTVRHEQWAELTGLEQAVTKALSEANVVGEVTPLLWENIAGYEAALRKQRDLFRRNVLAHSSALAKRKGHQERREYIEKNGEAILLDLHSLLLAHKSWFEYQALRAGRARLSAGDEPREAKLLQAIVDNARAEYGEVLEQMSTILDTLNRELSILAELPGRRTIRFTSGRRSAEAVAKMAKQLLTAVERLSDSVRQRPAPLERPETVLTDGREKLDKDLRILRWHLDSEEELVALVTALELHTPGGLPVFGDALRLGNDQQVLVAVTPSRVVVADRVAFREQGTLLRVIPNDQIRYVRRREDDGTGHPRVDLITRDEDFAWRFFVDQASPVPSQVAALLGEHMDIPEAERDAMRAALLPRTRDPKELDSGATEADG